MHLPQLPQELKDLVRHRRLCPRHRLCRSTLQAFAIVASTWTPEQIAEILSLRDGEGRRITASHVPLIARIRPRHRQREWIERVVTDKIGVNQLKKLLGSNGAG